MKLIKLYLIDGTSCISLFTLFFVLFPLVWLYSGSGAIGFAFTMVMQFLIGKRVNEKRFGFINTVAEKASSTESVSGRFASYYDHSNAKLIFVDCRSGMITFTKQQSVVGVLSPTVFSANEIIEFYYYDPGMTTTRYYGNSLAEGATESL